MKRELLIAGFGGQGVMAMGKMLVEAGMAEGRWVSWVPSYGPEMRGGNANCAVILSDRPIGCPLVYHPTDLIVMNPASLDKFGPQVAPGGRIFLNDTPAGGSGRRDVARYALPCDEVAARLGVPRGANMVMLGLFAGVTGLVAPATLEGLLEHLFSGPKAPLLQGNLDALREGLEAGEGLRRG